MKVFLVAASFALARAACTDDASCNAIADCHYSMGGNDCNFPDYKVGCCGLLNEFVDCGSDVHCDIVHDRGVSHGENHWVAMGWSGQNVDENFCPGSGRLFADLAQFCESADLLYGTPQPAMSGPLLPGVIGFALGAAVVTSAVIAMKKKGNPADTYSPLLAEDAA